METNKNKMKIYSRSLIFTKSPSKKKKNQMPIIFKLLFFYCFIISYYNNY